MRLAVFFILLFCGIAHAQPVTTTVPGTLLNNPLVLPNPVLHTGAPATLTGNGQGTTGTSATLGTIIQGQGSTNDITIENKAGTAICKTATGTTALNCVSLSINGTAETFPGSGIIAGTTDTQTLTNKTLTTPTINTPAINSAALTGTLSGTPTVSGAWTWSSGQTFPNVTTGGKVFIGGYTPWFDVMSGAHSCAVATGNGTTDDQPAIQCAINFMCAGPGGGLVFFPQGLYKIASTIDINCNVQLFGTGQNNSQITTGGSDLTAIAFQSGANKYAGLLNMAVLGDQSTSAGADLITVANNIPVLFRDCQVFGGNFALFTGGIDGHAERCQFSGWGSSGGAVQSMGANWWQEDSFDQAGPSNAGIYAFNQITPFSGASSGENHFVMCDFSGAYTWSYFVNDTTSGGPLSITVIEGSVLSSPIGIATANAQMFVGDEFGSSTFTNNSSLAVIVSASAGIGTTVTIGGSGSNKACSANINIGSGPSTC